MRSLAVAVSLAVVLSAACPDDELVGYCRSGAACWTDVDGTARLDEPPVERLRGACTTGTSACADGIMTCSGEILPGDLPETCNGVDDDCDRLVDEYLFLYSTDPDNPCERKGECGGASARCQNGAMVCDYFREPRPEVCDCRDNDCDGESDEGLDEPEAVYPYEEFPNTVGIGACRFGVISACVDCMQYVTPPVTPVQEICGNDVDDDCDGLTDEPAGPPEPRAFALVIDISGSMLDNLAPVTDAVCAWSADFNGDGSRFALVLVGVGGIEPNIVLRQDFSDAATTCATLNSPGLNANATGNEYMLDGVAIAMQLDWPAEAESRRHVLAFGDEEQHYYQEGGVDEIDVVDGCLFFDTTLDAFVPSEHASEWDAMTGACGGYVSDLDDAPAMIAALRERFAGGC